MSTRPLVFIGGDNSPKECWPESGVVTQYLDSADRWKWVLDNVDGYFAVAIGIRPARHSRNRWVGEFAKKLKNKNAFYETDMNYSSAAHDIARMTVLKESGFKITHAALNKHGGDPDAPRWSKERIDAIKSQCPGPLLAQEGPFAIDGSIHTAKGELWKDAIEHTNGSATDGPLGHWGDHSGGLNGMHSCTRDGVYYAHGLNNRKAMVMLATHTSGSNANLLKYGKHCVRWLESVGAVPDIWAISYYACDYDSYVVAPEANDGFPAETVTGLAYWLLEHLGRTRDVSVYPHTSRALHSHWKVRGEFDGYTLIENRATRQNLEVTNNNQSDLADVGAFYHIDSTPHAHWRLKREGEYYSIMEPSRKKRYLQVDDARTEPEASVSVYRHTRPLPDHALWKKVRRDGDWFSLIPKHYPSSCLQINLPPPAAHEGLVQAYSPAWHFPRAPRTEET